MPKDIDELAAEFEAAQAADQDDVIVADDNTDNDDDNTDDTPGFMDYDAWVAAGKDPDDYRGKNAYKAQYDNIQDNKALKTEIQGMKGMLTDVVDAAEQTRLNQAANYKADLEAKLAQQIEDMQPKEALATQKEIDAIDDKPKAVEVNPVISTFIGDNPILDPDSADYNAEFAADMISFHNAGADAMGGRNGNLSNAQVQKIMKKAFADAKALNSELFTSSRNNRGGATRTNSGKKPTKTGKLSEYQLDEGTNHRNSDAANEIYETIKAKDPARAEIFRKNLMGA